MIMRNKLIFNIVSLIILLSIGISFTGCTNDSEYKAVTVTKSGINFSFEYPISYEEYAGSFTKDDSIVAITQYAPNTDKQKSKGEIIIQTWSTNSKAHNAADLLDGYLKDIPNFTKDFQVLERSSIRVSEINGEIIVTSGAFSSEIVGTNLISYDLKSWDVYLDYKELIVTIELFSDINNTDEAKKDFEHLIQSFKFLD